MWKYGIIIGLVVLAGAGAAYYFASVGPVDAGGGGGFGGAGRGATGARPPMTVELASVTRGDLADTVTVVGNLIGAATEVVDIRTARLVINVVEKDLRRIHEGTRADVEVDAYPGEIFHGRVARIAPILDPASRTAQVEIAIPNSTYRLKPGMYARATFTVEKHEHVLVVPTLAVVDVSGKIGVFLQNGDTANFHPVTVGIEHQDITEIMTGLEDGQRIISTGAAALREGDRVALAGARSGGAAIGRGGGHGRNAPQGQDGRSGGGK